MMKKTLTSVAFAAGCAIALAGSAVQAQTLDMQASMYERLLAPNSAERHARMLRECGPITNAHLRAGCMDSFGLSEARPSRGLNEGLTGNSNGRMNSIDRTFQGPEMFDPRLGR